MQSTQHLEAMLVPQEDAGRFVKVLRGSWTAKSGPISKFRLRCNTACSIRLRATAEPSSLPIKVAVFAAGGQDEEETASSGPYAAYVAGVTIPQIRLRQSQDGYTVVISPFTAGSVGRFSLTVLSDRSVQAEAEVG